jgi:hypothetical protein
VANSALPIFLYGDAMTTTTTIMPATRSVKRVALYLCPPNDV